MSCHSGPYNRGIVTNGLVLYYDVNEPVCYSSGRTDIQDLSRNGNTGTLVNGVGYSGDNGGSLVFDGVNDYVDTGKYFETVITGTNSFSIEFWANPNSTQSAYNDIFGNHDPRGIVIQQNASTTNQYYFAYNNGSAWIYTSNFDITSNLYNHIVIAKNSTYTSIYKNGTRIAYNNLTTGIVAGTTYTCKIGTGWSGGLRCFNGQIPIFKIYSKELSSSEIQQNFNAHRSRFGL